MKRRVLLARALVAGPDLLLLDEPTNHLDIEAIDWLEGFLKAGAAALVFVTHDRRFRVRWPPASSRSTAARSPAGPATGTTTCAAARSGAMPQAQENARFDKAAGAGRSLDPAGHQGPPHPRRRSRAPAQGHAHERASAASWPERQDGELALAARDLRKKVIEATHARCAFDGACCWRTCRRLILRGDRIGLIGPERQRQDHAAKSATGRAATGNGEVRLGTSLQIAYFDQYRSHPARGLDRNRERRRRPRLRRDQWQPQACASATCRTSCSPRSARARRSPACPAASATACCWPSCSPSRPTCW